MVHGSASRGESIERWSPTVFLVAGVLLSAYAALNGVAAGTDVAYPTVEDAVGPGGFAVGFIGLLGLYPTLVERRPRVARVGAVCVSLGAVGSAAISVTSLGRLASVVPAEPSMAEPVLLGMVVVGMIPGFVTFGAVNLHANVHPRTIGLLLLAPAAIFAVMLSQAALFEQFGLFSETAMAWSAVAISGGQALAYLAIGHTLRTTAVSTERDVATADASAG